MYIETGSSSRVVLDRFQRRKIRLGIVKYATFQRRIIEPVVATLNSFGLSTDIGANSARHAMYRTLHLRKRSVVSGQVGI